MAVTVAENTENVIIKSSEQQVWKWSKWVENECFALGLELLVPSEARSVSRLLWCVRCYEKLYFEIKSMTMTYIAYIAA